MKTPVVPVSLLAVLAAVVPAAAGAGACPCAARPDLGAAVDALVKDLVARAPELKHVDPSRVLLIAADARHASRATTRPTRFPDGTTATPDGKWERPKTFVDGKEILYIVELRPKFFRASTVEQRIGTIVHEMLHMSPAFDGTITEEASHKRGGVSFDDLVRTIVGRYLTSADVSLVKPFARDGEVVIRQWLERPPNKLPGASTTSKRVYGAGDFFTGPIEMITRPSALKRAIERAGKGPLKPADAEITGRAGED